MRRKVAVKVLHTPLRDAEGRQAFERECANAGRVGQHPNTANVYTSIHSYAVLRPGQPGGQARGRAALRGGRGADRRGADRRGAAVRPQPGHLPPGREAGEHPVRRVGRPSAHRFRHRHRPRCRHDPAPRDDGGLRCPRGAALRRRRGERRLVAGRRAVRAARRLPAVLGPHRPDPQANLQALTGPPRPIAVPTCPPTCRKRWPARSPGGTTTAPCRLAAWPRNCRRTRPGSASRRPRSPCRPRPRPGPDRRPGRPAPDHAAPIRRGASRVHPHHGRWHPDPGGAPATDGGGGFATGNGPAGYGTGSVTTDGPQARHYAAPPTGRLDTGDAYRAPQASQGQARRRLPGP